MFLCHQTPEPSFEVAMLSANALKICPKFRLFGKELTLSQTTNFRLFQTETEFAHYNFTFDEIERKFTKRVENTVGKGEIVHYKQFFLFLQCFQKTCTVDM